MNIRHWSCRAVALMMLWLFTARLFAAQNPAASGTIPNNSLGQSTGQIGCFPSNPK
jgi:hypothetical protein